MRRFVVGAALTIVAAMTILTYALSGRIAASLMQRTADDSAILVNAVLGPHVQSLAKAPRLTPAAIDGLDIVVNTQLKGRGKSIKIWGRDGAIVYASDARLIGLTFSAPRLHAAFRGGASGQFSTLEGPQHEHERSLNLPLIEVYAPIYDGDGSRIIAVGEFYISGEKLAYDLRSIQIAAAAIVAAVTTPMMLLLFLMVRRAGAAVSSHQLSLQRKIVEAHNLAEQNDHLRRAAEESKLEAARSNERLLDQIGQDLHDGPIQLLSLMMLKLTDSNEGDAGDATAAGRNADVRELAAHILKEVRDISAGLVLPLLDGLTTADVVRLAVRQHEHLTGTSVDCRIDDLPADVRHELKVTLFRVVQEGLNNAFLHAGGLGQEVVASSKDGAITVAVRDGGLSASRAALQDSWQDSLRDSWRDAAPRTRPGLGLAGLKRRLASLRGTFESSLQPGERGEIRATLPVD